MNAKLSLALIALVGVGVFALPSTMALFAGQHSFYNIDATGNQVPCVKCHGDVKAELGSGSSSLTGTKGPHADFKCEYCHRAEAGMASGDNAYAKITFSNDTGGSIYLITTVANFENGNFPKVIVYQTGMTVDNWDANVYETGGVTPFVNQTDLLMELSRTSFAYAGVLTSNGVAGSTYNYSYASESSTYSAGSPKDKNTSTQNNAFNPRAVTFNATWVENLNNSGSREVTPGTKYHAASLVSCMECHGGEQAKGVAGYEIDTAEPYNHAGWLIDPTDTSSSCSNCHYSTASHTPAFETRLAAGGFGLTGGDDTGATEAHNELVTADSQGILRNASDGYGANNIGCVACHTHVAVDINFQKKYKVKLDAYGTGTGTWNVGGFAAEGDVMISTYGNSDGSVFATGNKSYDWSPAGTLYINGNASTPVVGLSSDTNDNQTALTT